MHRVLYFVEGFTDIRFVVGLSEICDLTMVVPARHYRESGLKQRVADAAVRATVHEIEGGRPAFQARSLAWLWRHAPAFDLVLSQEVMRGSLNANLVGTLRGVPVLTTMAIDPVAYFRCRRERGQVGVAKWLLIESVIRALMAVNGRLAARCLALGPYLCDVARPYCARTANGGYYGVDTAYFRPADPDERIALRRRHDLPTDRFVILLSSRISHEKDPETVLRATALARARGLDAVLLNLGGGYQEFLQLASALGLPNPEAWVMGRPAAHPMKDLADYFRSVDAIAQASLAEGLGLSTLEALACGTPVVATRVGGMARALDGYARLSPRRDPAGMADQMLWVAAHPAEARAEALRGRAMVDQTWSRARVFADLARTFDEVVAERSVRAPASAPEARP